MKAESQSLWWYDLAALSAIICALGFLAKASQTWVSYQQQVYACSRAEAWAANEISEAEKRLLLRLPPCTPLPDPNPERDQWRNEQDLNAQRQMAGWTAVMGGVGVLGIGLSAIGIILLYRTLRATQEGLDAARDAARATREVGQGQSKAYLEVTGGRYQSMPTQSKNGLAAVAKYVFLDIANYGSSVATDVSIRYRVEIGNSFDTSDYIALGPRYTTQKLSSIPPNTNSLSRALGKSIADQVQEAAESNSGQTTTLKAVKSVLVVGEIRYLDIFGNRYRSHFQIAGSPFQAMSDFQFVNFNARVPMFEEIKE